MGRVETILRVYGGNAAAISALLALLVVTQAPTQASAQGLLDKPPRVFVAPNRLFQIQIPDGWQIATTADPNTIQFTPNQGGDAYMWVRRINVPQGAHPRQLALHAIDSRLKKLSLFKVINQRNTKIGGHRASTILGTYAHQGNIQFPRAVEEVFVVTGSEAFILHFECFEPVAGHYAPTLNTIYQSFMARPPGIGTTPYSTNPTGSQFPAVDKVSF